MAVLPTVGSHYHVEKRSSAPETPTPTDITKASPAVVTVDAIGSLEENGLITIAGSDFGTIDDKPWIIKNISGNTLELLGSDTTGEMAAFNPAATASALKASDLQLVDPSSFDPAPGTATDVDVQTFENPERTLPGVAPAGSWTMNGFVDTADVGYREMLLAEEDKAPRKLRIEVNGQGYMVADIYVGANQPGLPLQGAPTFAFTGTFGSKLRHLFA